ncbi:hypothetical protein ILUMI_19871, partial [Ignelater luminosus]
ELPFRGHSEQFGNLHSGNFLGTVELFAQFHPFLADHLKSFTHPGTGKKVWSGVLDALNFIAESTDEKPSTRSEATGLQKKLKRLEAAILVIVWNTILDRFNSTSKKLQQSQIDLSTVVQLYDSVALFLQDMRNKQFSHYEEKAKLLSGVENYYGHDTRRKIIKFITGNPENDDAERHDKAINELQAGQKDIIETENLLIDSAASREVNTEASADSPSPVPPQSARLESRPPSAASTRSYAEVVQHHHDQVSDAPSRSSSLMSVRSAEADLKRRLKKAATARWNKMQHMKNMCDVYHEGAIDIIREAAKEEAELAIQNGDVDADDTPIIIVIVDGAWSKRSYKTDYNALPG